MKQFRLENLEVYQLSIEIADEIWEIAIKWNNFAQHTVSSQLVRASDSVAANIAEGYGRYYYKENKQFCFYARGSLLETKTWLLKSKNRKLISGDLHKKWLEKMEVIHRKLNAYIKTIGKTPTQ